MVGVCGIDDSPWGDIESHRLRSWNMSTDAKAWIPLLMNKADRGHQFGVVLDKIGEKGAENGRI
jgi:hypothetical protein